MLPLAHLVTAVQDPWFGFGWSATDLVVPGVYAVAAGGLALWFFRWNWTVRSAPHGLTVAFYFRMLTSIGLTSSGRSLLAEISDFLTGEIRLPPRWFDRAGR